MSDEQEAGVWLENHECVDCLSKNNLSVYEKSDGSIDGFCQTPKCGYKSNNKLADTYLAATYDIKKIERSRDKVVEKTSSKVVRRRKDVKVKKPLTKESVTEIAKKTSAKGKGFRSQCDKELAELKVRTEYNGDGSVQNRYYPIWKRSISSLPVGFKKRIVLPKKDFRVVGLNDSTVDLFGEELCTPKKDSYILLESGEEDTIAARKMIKMFRKSKNKSIDVVCSSHSETAQYKQIQAKYDFFDSYQTIIIAMDEDEAGRTSTEELLNILPTGKVKVMSKPNGDANDCLIKGGGEQWLFDFYAADKPKLAGITGSSELLEDMFSNTSFEKLPLPAFMEEINEMLEGGYDFGTFNIIAGDTSVGKTTDVNEIATCIIEQGDYKPLILSLEAKKSVLAKQYLSLKLGQRLGKFKSESELRGYIGKHQEEVDTFLYKEGENTFEVIDDRARLTSVDDTFDMIERAIRSLGCRVIIIDPASDLTDSLTVEQQASFNSRIKALIATHNVLVIGIYHTRKLDGLTKDGKRRVEPTRYDIYGSKTTINSATTIMLIWRDASAEDEEERNTTYVSLDKNRDHAVTGRAGEWMYVKEKHRMMNKKRWLLDNTGEY